MAGRCHKAAQPKHVVEATYNLIDLIEAELGLGRAEDVQLELRELRRVVPAQKIAPVQFFFRDDRLAVLQTKSTAGEDDRENVAAAKQQLQASGVSGTALSQKSYCNLMTPGDHSSVMPDGISIL